MSIKKQVNCAKCGSFIHRTERCDVWYDHVYCSIDRKYKTECSCEGCAFRCIYCNNTISHFLYDNKNNCCDIHNGTRCVECNEFLHNGVCFWDHSKSSCVFCNSPIISDWQVCVNDHKYNGSICLECNMPCPPYNNHEHDGNKCKICNTLLNEGRCIYGCVGGGKLCLFCNYEGLVNNICRSCRKDNAGYLTKQAKK